MTDPARHEPMALQRTVELLGGNQVLRHAPRDPMDVHELLLEGLPGRALIHLIESLVTLRRTVSVEKGVGMSLRTFQRRAFPISTKGSQWSGINV